MRPSRHTIPALLVTLLFFLSGFAGLVYEVVWTRVFADIVGSTALSMTAVFSVFLLCLACGARLFGRLSFEGRAALRLYGLMEIGIALSALASSAMLIQGRSWIATHIPSSGPFALILGIQLFATVLLIGVPTLLMGGTLPVILSAARAWMLPRNVVAHLYGWNTLGAASGALAAGFLLIWRIGLARTLGVAMALNLIAGLGALIVAATIRSGRAVRPEPPAAEAPREASLWPALAFFSGFCIIAYEILWGRMAKFLLGDRTVAIALLLFVFITCLGLGSLLAPAAGRRFGSGPRGALAPIAWILLFGALLHLVAVPLAGATVAGGGLAAIVTMESEFWRRVLIVSILIAPAILVLGLVFPLLAWSAREMDHAPGRTIGRLYFINTIGAVAGAATASFLLSRWLGTLGGFLLLSGLLIAGSLFLLLRQAGRGRWLVAGCVVALFLAGALLSPNSLVHLQEDEELVASNEDEYGVQLLARTEAGTLRLRNNRLSLIHDLGRWETAHAQQMAAHLTALLARECGEVLNVGTGYGITAGAFTLYDSVRLIETVEILPFIVSNQELFSRHNFDYLKDPRVTLIQGDGRHHLATSDKSYDIISVNVLDPYLPGSSSLFTVDFWEMARKRLRPGGVFTGLFWGADVELLDRGLRSVFPTLLYFPAYGNSSFNVVAFRDELQEQEIRYHFERLSPEAKEVIRQLLGGDPIELFERELEGAVASGRPFAPLPGGEELRLHTDDFPILEYRWAHGVEWVSILDSPMVSDR